MLYEEHNTLLQAAWPPPIPWSGTILSHSKQSRHWISPKTCQSEMRKVKMPAEYQSTTLTFHKTRITMENANEPPKRSITRLGRAVLLCSYASNFVYLISGEFWSESAREECNLSKNDLSGAAMRKNSINSALKQRPDLCLQSFRMAQRENVWWGPWEASPERSRWSTTSWSVCVTSSFSGEQLKKHS